MNKIKVDRKEFEYKRIGSITLQEYIDVWEEENPRTTFKKPSYDTSRRIGAYLVKSQDVKPQLDFGYPIVLTVKHKRDYEPSNTTITEVKSSVKDPKELGHAYMSPYYKGNFTFWGGAENPDDAKSLMKDWFKTFREDKR